jgi:Fe-S-cluster containining protein
VTFDVRKNRPWLIQWATASDPQIDFVWETRYVKGRGKWKDDRRSEAIRNYLNARWIIDHWHDLGDGDTLCDAFDPKTRTCLAYDDRPPICSNYPWYGQNPDAHSIASLRCSFCADVPKEDWPKGVRIQIRRKVA